MLFPNTRRNEEITGIKEKKLTYSVVLVCTIFWSLSLIQFSGVHAIIPLSGHCTPEKFRCHENCIPLSWKCDGQADCADGRDEQGCENATISSCSPKEFLCNNICVPLSWKCDGEKDCGPDWFDEKGCAPITCSSNQFQCKSSSRCIPTIWLCDGEEECEDGSDEKNCQNHTCAANYFHCVNNNKCLRSHWVCDGYNDCGDFSDERNCNLTCSPGEFTCPNGHCIPKSFVCDGHIDCEHNADEPANCTKGTCNPSSEFTCLNGKCISKSWRCDGTRDCSDGSDENGCVPSTCPPNFWNCIGTSNCIALNQVCNGIDDCDDNSDEGPHCMDDDCKYKNCSQYCRQTSKGAVCYCEKGYAIGKNDRTCTDIDECENVGICDQVCHNTQGSYRCKCTEGYDLEPPRTCKPKDSQIPWLIFASHKEIRRLSTNGNVYKNLIGNLSRAVALDFDLRDQKIYWSDVTDNAIYRTNFPVDSESNIVLEKVINTELAVTDGLAVDWIGRNLYFVDSKVKTIFVCKLDGSHRVSLINTKLKKPRAVTLDPRDGFMFWSDWDAHTIERANMNGANRTVLSARNIYSASALTVDYPLRTLYWADGFMDYIGAMSYYGEDVRKLWPHMAHPFALTLFGNYLYFTDWTRLAVVKVDKFRGKETAMLKRSLMKPMDIQVYHSVRQPLAFNACTSCGCQHICLLTVQQGCTCKCEMGYRLSSDSKSCVALDSFLVYAAMTQICGISLEDTSDVFVPILGLGNILALDFDSTDNSVYFIDALNENINRVSLPGRDVQLLVDLGHTSYDVAIDWRGRNLYWTDVDMHEISVARLNGSFKTSLFHEDIRSPRSIAVSPIRGLLFWSDWGSPARIEATNMDGSNRRVLVQGNGLEWPNSLAVDISTDELYWADAKKHTIECVFLNGTHRRIVIQGLQHPLGLDIFDGFIYWSDWSAKHIRKAAKQKPNNITVVKSGLMGVIGLKVYSSSRQQGKSACSDGTSGCTHLCLLNPAGYSCGCPFGWKLDHDNKTCLFNSTVIPECAPGLFRCKSNNLCIPARWKCDGEGDCMDNSDEGTTANCSVLTKCRSDQFHCQISGTCIAKSLQCDGKYDCRDETDELLCFVKTNCTRLQFKCANGKCIPKSWLCDKMEDCLDGSDEKGCGKRNCSLDEFSCSDGHCISRIWLCDGDLDCKDGGDEKGCDRKCGPKQFRCDSNKCLERDSFCDGRVDCLDGTDEKYCNLFTCNSTSAFQCNNSLCIPKKLECDLVDDCGDGSDEHPGCNRSTCHEFTCANKACVIRELVCDGADDCGDWSDEMNCGPVVKRCKPDQWRCSNNATCIRSHQVCDKNIDCPDGSDEGPGCNIRQCRKAKGGCSQLCRDVPSGAQCYCLSGFKLSNDGRNCVDVDECKNVSTCSQQCTNTLGSYRCQCVEGYALMEDRRTCKKTDKIIPYLYFSTRNEIRKIDIPLGLPRDSKIRGYVDIIGLDFDWKEQRVYWSDLYRRTISRSFLNGTGKEDVITDGLITTEGVAVDWLGRRLYWSDMKADRIEVATLDGKWRIALVSTDLKSPRGLVLDPRDGYMFWTDWGDSPRIERSSLDGSDRVKLATENVVWPNGITLDYANRRVYWIDARLKHIEFCNYDGSNRHVVLKGQSNIHHPFAMTLFEDWVYWCDWGQKRVYRAHKTHGGGSKSYFRGALKPMDIHAVHPLRQPEGRNYCSNATCSHLCLLVPRGYACKCPIGMALSLDQHRCTDDFASVVFATRDEVRGISLDPNVTADLIVSTSQLKHGVAVDFDYRHGYIYWSDVEAGSISRIAINGSLRQTIVQNIGKPEGIAVDWVAGNIYWTDNIRSSIGVARTDGSYAMTLLSKDIGKPRGIAVHPVKGLLFWSNWHSNFPRIEQSSLDGSSRRVLVRNRLGYPNGISIDYVESRLYWCDASKDVIESIRLDGLLRRVVIARKQVIKHPFDISVFGKTIYWSDWDRKTIFYAPKRGITRKKDIKVLRHRLQHIFGVQVYSARRQLGSNVCKQDNGGCQQLCLAKNATIRRCACAVGFKLAADKQSCLGIERFILYSTPRAIYGVALDHKDNTTAMNPIRGMRSINNIDFLYNSSWIFYTDDRTRTIGRVNRDGTGKKTIVSTGLRRPQGIAVDWVGMNLFWTDAGTDLIEVSSLNGSHRHVIISTGLSEPRSIVVYPAKGFMYWTDWGSPPRIERSLMDGSFRRTLKTGSKIRKPSGLTIDYKENLLYWVDVRRDVIWKTDLDGGNMKKVIDGLKQPSGLTLYGGLLHWTDRSQNILQSVNKNNGKNLKNKPTRRNPRDVQIYDSGRQPAGGACQGNGGCQELCLAVSRTKIWCACPSGRLASNKLSCVPEPNFIIVSKTTEIKFMSLIPGKKVSPQPPLTDINADMQRSLDFDYDSERIFYSDTSPPSIKSVKIDGSDLRNLTLGVIKPGGLAVDWLEKRVYWTDIALDTISRINFNGSSLKIVVKNGLYGPRAIAVFPCEKVMYWIEWGPRFRSIKSAWMDGMGIKTIVSKNLGWPYGLTIDYTEGKLYWADEGVIESSLLDGTQRKRVIAGLQRIFAVTLLGEFVYWTDWRQFSVMRANKYNGGDPISMSRDRSSGLPMDIKVFAKERQDCTINPCALNGGCTQVCTPLNGHPVCSCQTGYTLVDGYRCIIVNAQCHYSNFTCTNGKCISDLAVCDSTDDCDDGSDELALVCAKRVCRPKQFKCNHGRCISAKWLCDYEDDCGDGSDEHGCPPRTCASNQFRCANGLCINANWKCDFADDCGDNSDEMGCPTRQCAGNQFRCANGRCKPYSDKCDGNNDCGDFSDEQGCKDIVCPPTRIKCYNTSICIDTSWLCDGHDDCGNNWDEQPVVCSNNTCAAMEIRCVGSDRCIPKQWLCDGQYDCDDHSDERNCPTEHVSCSSDHFSCANGNCISRRFLCDGDDDCGDLSDELSNGTACTKRNCTGIEFKCAGSSRCIPLSYTCDGENDCGDDSDEHASLGCVQSTCSPSQFRCTNGLCIEEKWHCDHEDDCGDFSDETSCANHSCSGNQFRCKSGHCIPLESACNARRDCVDGSDEDPHRCSTTTPTICSVGTFQCDNHKCVDQKLVCNKVDDCGDLSDERQCNINECTLAHHKLCAHICTDSPVGYKCSCRLGYKLMADGRSCKDIDECSTYVLNRCNHFCENFEGSYRCVCASGYQLEPSNRRVCKAIGDSNKPYVIFSERHKIRSMDLNGLFKDIVLANVQAWAMDFDTKEGRVYWTRTGFDPEIRRAFLNGTGTEPVIKAPVIKAPEALAVDWVGRNLYFSDRQLDKVFVSTLTGTYIKVILKQLKPTTLVVYPEKGFLYYTVWNERPYIGRSGLDGTSPRPLVHAKLGWPTGLTICRLTKKLFWVDAKLHLVEYSDLDGSGRTQLAGLRIQYPFGIKIFEDFIYWTDVRQKTINRAFKWTGQKYQKLHRSTGKLHDLQVIHSSLQPQTKPSLYPKLACTGLCLLTPDGGAKCACPDNMHLADDGKTCLENCTNNERVCKNHQCIPRLWWCDGVRDCNDSSDEDSCALKRHCPSGTLQCQDGKTCVSSLQICNGHNDCISGEDERSCHARQCTWYQFRCRDNHCVFKSQVCDGVRNCQDGSDEDNCLTTSCTVHQFKCPNGRCISKKMLCDGDNDCGDTAHSDEAPNVCPTTCPSGFFRCKLRYQCIPLNWTCDGEMDCKDHSDEEKSLCSSVKCSSSMYECRNKKCIPKKWSCDGHNDCGDNSDEDDCKANPVLPHQFRCTSGRLIHKEWVCNGHDECGDDSDERNCSSVISCRQEQIRCDNGSCIEKAWKCDGKRDCQNATDENSCPSRYPNGRTCPEYQYQCKNQVCISRQWTCDGQNDCGDKSDEISLLCEFRTCRQFRCKNFRCIPKWKICDGVNDCGGKHPEDEDSSLCAKKTKPVKQGCTRRQFKCLNRKCVRGEVVCNGYDDCGDASDEIYCPNTSLSCAVNNGGCSQRCMVLAGKAVCSCWPGFELDSASKKCIDINECTRGSHCEQTCVNTRGSYKCVCTDGYVKSTLDWHRCKAIDGPPVLLFPCGSEIRRIVLSSVHSDYGTGVAGLPSVGSLDVLSEEGLVLWTDLKNKTIRRAKLPGKGRRRIRREVTSSMTVQDLSLPIGVAEGLAVDWIGKNIFWTDSKERVIKVARIDGRYPRTVVTAKLQNPGDLVVDPNRGRLYWTDRGNIPKIESSDMDGTKRSPLVTTMLIYPSGLAIDHTTQQLYWADLKSGRVERVGLDGRGRKLVLNALQRPSSVAVSGDMLYVTANDQVLQVNKFGFNKTVPLLGGLRRAFTIRVQQHQAVSQGNPCAINNGNCSHLCLRTSKGHVCACPDGDVNEVEPCNSVVVKPRPPPACSLTACGVGTCADIDGKAHCICPAGYTGQYCLTPILPPSVPSTNLPNPCIALSCYNGGSCILQDGKPFCKCPQGTAGARCEESCSSFYCKNGGECETSDQKIYCRCKSGYRYTIGPGCETDPCINHTVHCGHDGKCHVNGSTNQPYCRCSDGSLSESCTGNPSVSARKQSYVLPQIIIPIAMVVLVALAILVVAYCRHRGPMKPTHYCGMTTVRVGNPSFMYEEMTDDNISIASREFTHNSPDKGTNFSNPVYESILLHHTTSSTALLQDHDQYIADFTWNNVDFTNPVYEAFYGERSASRSDSLFRAGSSCDVSLQRESYA